MNTLPEGLQAGGAARPTLVIVGAFPGPGTAIYGGIIRVCQTLLHPSFAGRFELVLIDSTQISNPPPGALVRLVYACRRLVTLVTTLARHRPDALLLFTSAGASAVEKGCMAWIARLAGVRVLMFPRSGRIITRAKQSRLHLFGARAVFGGADIFLCQGAGWQEFAVDHLGFARDRAPVVPNWTASTELLSIGASRQVADPRAPVRLLFLGWLETFKGIFELLEAIRRLKAEGLVFQLTIAGRGHAEEDARAFVEHHGLGDCVRFAGWVQGPDLEQLLLASDVFVLPSWAEGLPNAMIEAMAAGLACVVTSVGMVPDYVTDGEQALLVPPREVQALQDALRRLLSDPGMRSLLARNGHRLAAEQFGAERAMTRLADIVEGTIAGCGAPAGNGAG